MVRAFPITSLTKEKRVTLHLGQFDQLHHEGLQLRSCTFQLMKLGFEEEVTLENADLFRKNLHRIRHPSHVLQHFAFCGQTIFSPTPLHKGKEKNATLK